MLGNRQSALVLAHTLVAMSTASECTPKYAHSSFYFLPLPPLFSLSFLGSKKAFGSLSPFQALCSFVFVRGVHSGICPSVPNTYISPLP